LTEIPIHPSIHPSNYFYIFRNSFIPSFHVSFSFTKESSDWEGGAEEAKARGLGTVAPTIPKCEKRIGGTAEFGENEVREGITVWGLWEGEEQQNGGKFEKLKEEEEKIFLTY